MRLLAPQSPRRPRLTVGASSIAVAWAITVAAVSPVSPSTDLDDPLVASNAPEPFGRVDTDLPVPSMAIEEPDRPEAFGPVLPRTQSESSEELVSTGAADFEPNPGIASVPDPSEGCRLRPDGVGFEDGLDLGIRGDGGLITSRDRFQQRSLGPYMLCLRTRGQVEIDPDGSQIGAMEEEAWVVLAARGVDANQRLEITRGPDGNEHAWFVNGEEQPFDAEATEWRDTMLRVLTAPTRITELRGDVARIQGEIARLRGEEARRRGDLARARGEESSLLGEIARIQGLEAAVRENVLRVLASDVGEPSRIAEMTVRISGVRAIADIEEQIELQRAVTARLETEIAQFARVAADEIQAIEEWFAAFDVEGRIEETRTELDAYEVRLEALVRGIR